MVKSRWPPSQAVVSGGKSGAPCSSSDETLLASRGQGVQPGIWDPSGSAACSLPLPALIICSCRVNPRASIHTLGRNLILLHSCCRSYTVLALSIGSSVPLTPSPAAGHCFQPFPASGPIAAISHSRRERRRLCCSHAGLGGGLVSLGLSSPVLTAKQNQPQLRWTERTECTKPAARPRSASLPPAVSARPALGFPAPHCWGRLQAPLPRSAQLAFPQDPPVGRTAGDQKQAGQRDSPPAATRGQVPAGRGQQERQRQLPRQGWQPPLFWGHRADTGAVPAAAGACAVRAGRRLRAPVSPPHALVVPLTPGEGRVCSPASDAVTPLCPVL